MMKVQSITIEAFRGFLEKMVFNFQDAEVLLLYGPNGHGKTSIFDGIEWALTGEIQRFSEASDERRRTRFIRNLHANSERTTYVTLELIINNGLVAKVTRTCTATHRDNTDYGKSKLDITIFGHDKKETKVDGEAAEKLLRTWLINEIWYDKVKDASRIIGLTHMLSQEKLSDFVRGMKDGERYNSLSVLFGTEHFMKYSDVFKYTLGELKNEIQLRVGQILEVKSAISNIEENIKKLNEKLADYGNVTLKDMLLPYTNHFANIQDAYEKEDWKKVQQIITENQENLSIERFNLENAIQHLKDAKNLLDRWRSGREFLGKVSEKREKLNQYLLYNQKLKQTESLIKQFPQFQKNTAKKRELKDEIQHAVLNTRRFIQKADNINHFIRTVKETLDKVLQTKDFELFNTIKVFDFKEDMHTKNEVLQHLKDMKSAQESLTNLKENQSINESLLENLSKTIEELKGVDQRYQNLLSSLNDYISVQTEIETCPVCGTQGISRDDLEEKVLSEQGKLSEHLPELEKRMLEMKRQIEIQNTGIKSSKKQLSLAINSINDVLRKLERTADENKDSAIREQRREQQLYSEISIIDSSLNHYIQEANKLEVDTATPNFIEKLKQLELELQSLLLPLSLEELANLSNRVQELNREEQQAQDDVNHFISKLDNLQCDTATIGNWTEEQIVSFLNDTSRNQLKSLEILNKKEEVTLKSLNAIECAKDELQLFGYQTDLKQKQRHLRILSEENVKIEEDSEAIKEVIANIKNAVDGLNNRMIDELFDTVQKVFVHINSHPLYSELKFSKEHRNKAYRLLIYVLTGKEDSEVPANASYIFSSAQVNSIALSFFIAMSLHQKWSPLQLIGMDDPIQSMDEINVLAFIDLIRLFIEKYDKQIIISTHDYTFYNMMLRKFRFQNVAVIEYEGYSERGPVIKGQDDDNNQLVQYHPKLKCEEIADGLYKLDHKL